MHKDTYNFTSHWRIQATAEEVAPILTNIASRMDWWPAVHTHVDALAPGNQAGVGEIVSFQTRGWLPYTLHWHARIDEIWHPHGFEKTIWGDMAGWAYWTLIQDGDYVSITYDWVVTLEKPGLRRLSAVLPFLFEMNYRWAMRQGKKSLKLELARRRARLPEERDQTPAPPAPVNTTHYVVIIALLTGIVLLLARWRRRRH